MQIRISSTYTQLYNLLKTFNKYGVKVRIKKKQPLIKRIINNKTETMDINVYSVVYQLDCELSNMPYVGDTEENS